MGKAAKTKKTRAEFYDSLTQSGPSTKSTEAATAWVSGVSAMDSDDKAVSVAAAIVAGSSAAAVLAADGETIPTLISEAMEVNEEKPQKKSKGLPLGIRLPATKVTLSRGNKTAVQKIRKAKKIQKGMARLDKLATRTIVRGSLGLKKKALKHVW